MAICLSLSADFNDVSFACKQICSNWEELAVHLKISRSTVETIRMGRTGQGIEWCLRELLAVWLKQPSPTQPKPSWRLLCNAVSHIDRPLSRTIWRDHFCRCTLCRAAVTRTTPISIAVLQEKPVDAVKELKNDFEKLLEFLTKDLENCKVNINVLRLQISKYFEEEEGVSDEIEKHLTKIEDYKTPHAILNYFCRHRFIGYINYSLVKVFQKIAKSRLLDRRIEEYEKDYQCFLELSLTQVHDAFQFPDLQPDYPAGIPKFTIHLESEWDGKSVFELKEFLKQRFNNSHGDCIDQLMIAKISRNCIIVTFAVLPHITRTILQYLTNDDVISTLKKEGITVDISKQLMKYQQKTTKKITTTGMPSLMEAQKNIIDNFLNEYPESVDQPSDITSGFCDRDTEGDTSVANFSLSTMPFSVEWLHREIVVVVDSHLSQLSDAVKHCLPAFAERMFERGFISETVKDNPESFSMVASEFKANFLFVEHIEDIEEKFGAILDIFRDLGGPLKDAADNMEEEIKKAIAIQPQPHGLPLTRLHRPGVAGNVSNDDVFDEEFQLSMIGSPDKKSPRSSLYTAASLEEGDADQLLEIVQQPVSFSKADKVLKNTMDALMDIKETPSLSCISMEGLRDIMYSETVRCNLLQAVVVGLPNCGKSNVLHQILDKVVITPAIIDTDPQKHSMQCYVANGLSSYGVVIVGQKPFDNLIWMPETRQSMHMFACTSAILHNSLLQNQQVELVDSKLEMGKKRFKGFKESALNTHMHRVYNDIDFLVEQCNLNPEISRILPSGVTSINIIDAAFNQGVYDFLSLTSQYCRHQLGFIFLDLERDIPALNKTPDIELKIGKDPQHMLQFGTRIFYLVRFAAVSYFSTNYASSFFVAVHNGTLPASEIESHIGTLRKAVCDEIQKQNLPPDMIEDVLPINSQKEEDLKRLKILFEKFIKSRQSAMFDLKLAYVFLRSLLSNDSNYSQKLSISVREIQPLCREMRLNDSEINTFLHKYTEFGSILFMEHILPDVIILQPAVFVNYLQKLFNPSNDGESSNGIISMSKAHRILGNANAALVVIPFLVKSGLGVELDRSEVLLSKQQATRDRQNRSAYLLFIPSSRPNNVSISYDSVSTLYISFSYKIVPPNIAGMFLQKLLKLGYLIPSNFRNHLSLKLRNGGHQLDIVFDLKYISLKLEANRPRFNIVDACKNILFQCNDALSDITVSFPDLKYNYGLKCLKQPSIHILDGSSENLLLCDYCRSVSNFSQHNAIREDWCNAVNIVEQAKNKAVEMLSLESLIEIAKTISTIESVSDSQIMSALNLSDEEKKVIKSMYQGDRHMYILSMLLAWVTKIGKRNATKQKLYNTLFHATA